MPELPDITIYIEALRERIAGAALAQVRIASPFLLRTAVPPVAMLAGKKVTSIIRLGKRIVLGFESDLWLVLHLMISGRLHWIDPPYPESGLRRTGSPPHMVSKSRKLPSRKDTLAVFEFSTGLLTLSEASTKRRASLHLVQGAEALRPFDPGGLEVMDCSLDDFVRVLKSRNHTLKRALSDPRLFSGIGNAYSDEILHRARLSPVALTSKLLPEQMDRLHRATTETLDEWVARLRQQAGDAFPEHVTAFRPEMAVHGKFGLPCPVCGTTVQRIRYADNETNYCPKCQTGGKLLADRSLSLLLKKDWPKTPEELEELRSGTDFSLTLHSKGSEE